MKNRYAVAGMILPLLCGTAAHAALTCEQLVAIAQTTVGLRNQGVALNALLADAGRDNMKSQFSAAELEVIRRTIARVYTGEISPYEISQSCRDNGK